MSESAMRPCPWDVQRHAQMLVDYHESAAEALKALRRCNAGILKASFGSPPWRVEALTLLLSQWGGQ